MRFLRRNKTTLLSLIFAITMLISFGDIIFSDYKIILFVLCLFGLFWIIYYFSETIFKKGDEHDSYRKY
jgi:hypothetical protein